MKRVIVHGGFHKTGSSALQAHLSQLAPFLEENGVSYPYAESESVIAAGACSGNLPQILFREGWGSAEGMDEWLLQLMRQRGYFDHW